MNRNLDVEKLEIKSLLNCLAMQTKSNNFVVFIANYDLILQLSFSEMLGNRKTTEAVTSVVVISQSESTWK